MNKKQSFASYGDGSLGGASLCSVYGRIDSSFYPFVQIRPQRFCESVNQIWRNETGRYCSGLSALCMWEMRTPERVDAFFTALYTAQTSRYRGIGRKTAAFVDSLVSRVYPRRAPSAPFLLLRVRVNDRSCCDPDQDGNLRWLLAVDTRHQVGHAVFKEEWFFPQTAYNDRLRISSDTGHCEIHYMVDDIMVNQFTTWKRSESPSYTVLNPGL